jgi:MscS family membrane protein
MLKEHPDIDPVPARVRFTEFGEHSLNLNMFTYIKTREFNKYLEIVEDRNLRMLDIVSAAGTQLALPARSVRFEGEAGADK